MILVDTSVWVEHLRARSGALCFLLDREEVFIHRLVIGELSVGNLPQRDKMRRQLLILPRIAEASFEDCLGFLEQRRLFGCGLGWNDAQLLAAAWFSSTPLWSLDRRLAEAAARLGCAWTPPAR